MKRLRGTEAKLANERFVQRAPELVVQYERDKVVSLRAQRERLAGKLQALT